MPGASGGALKRRLWGITCCVCELLDHSSLAVAFPVASLPENFDEARAEALVARGVAPLLGLETALGALKAAQTGPGRPGWRPAPALEPRATRLLDEAEGKRTAVSDERDRTIFGVAWQFLKGSYWVLDYDRLEHADPTIPTEDRLQLTLQIKY